MALVGLQFQILINQVLYNDDNNNNNNNNDDDDDTTKLLYSPTMDWKTPFPTTTSIMPLQALSQALEDYRRVDVAITAGRPIEDLFDLSLTT